MKTKLLYIKEATGTEIRCDEDIIQHMTEESQADRECAWILHLNSKNRLLEKELISMGTQDTGFMNPREIFRKALIQGSSQIIIVHNHPSGDTTPSDADQITSEHLLKASKILRIPILDFIIIAHKKILSFKAEGIGGFSS